MQEIWTFDYSLPLTHQTLQEFLNSKSKELNIFLSYYYKKEGAVVEHVLLKHPPLFLDSVSGKITLAFELVFFNACLAINTQEKDEMEISFEFAPLTKQLKLAGAYWPDRGMDEI